MPTLTPISVGNLNAAFAEWDTSANGDLGDNSTATYGDVTTNSDGNRREAWELDNPTTADIDFGTMVTLACVVQYRWSGTPTNTTWENPDAAGTEGITVYIQNAAGDTQLAGASSALADAEEIVAVPTAETETNSSSIPFTYVDTTADATAWDGAVVVITIGRNRAKGGGTEGQRIVEIDFTGTYSAAVVNPLGVIITAAGGLTAQLKQIHPVQLVGTGAATVTVTLKVERVEAASIGGEGGISSGPEQIHDLAGSIPWTEAES